MTHGPAHERALPHSDARYQIAHHFLVEEAAALDAQAWDAWLAMLHTEIRYVMPVRVTTSIGTGYDSRHDMAHFDDDHHTLTMRIARLKTEHAWTEDPPSRTRHLVTNVRVHAAGAGEIAVQSTVLLFRSRGDTRPPELVCADRHDLLRERDGVWLLARRTISVEESVLRTQNLAILL